MFPRQGRLGFFSSSIRVAGALEALLVVSLKSLGILYYPCDVLGVFIGGTSIGPSINVGRHEPVLREIVCRSCGHSDHDSHEFPSAEFISSLNRNFLIH